MTPQIRQPYTSYPKKMLERARAELRDGLRSKAISVSEFAKRHGVPRTTAQGWKPKVERKKELLFKGAQRSLGRYQETQSLNYLLTTAEFQSLDSICGYVQAEHEITISVRTAQRWLQRWGIAVNARWPQDLGKDGRPLLLWRRKWCQPDDTVYESTPPLQGILWLLITRKGMKGFMLTDDSDKAISRVVTALETTMTPRHRLFTNYQKFAEVAKSHARWQRSKDKVNGNWIFRVRQPEQSPP